jgi:predicted DNA-binding protein YlxM (UPF0122 family)
VEIYEQRELQAFVAHALQQLPEEQRLAITLFYLSGYSHQEVADFLNLTKSQVNNRLYSARNTLKERIFAMTKATLNEQRPSNNASFTNGVIDRIRLANPTQDFPRIAQLLSADTEETTSAQDLLFELRSCVVAAIATGFGSTSYVDDIGASRLPPDSRRI